MTKTVMLTAAPPFEGIPHAGGQYVLRLYRYLKADRSQELTVFVQDGPSAREALRQSPAVDQPNIIPRDRSTFQRLIFERLPVGLRHFFIELRGDAAVRRGITRDAELIRNLREADVVDLQWEAYARLAPLIRRYAPQARMLATFHDVDSQRWARRVERSRGIERVLSRVAVHYSRASERKAADVIDTCLVFSEKDRALLGEAGVPIDRVEVIDPPIDFDHATSVERQVDADSVLFVGWLKRTENVEAAEWLLKEVWPTVLLQRPEARLRIVGRDAPPEFCELADQFDSVSIVGFVDDLSAEYAKAAVAVVPLRNGAGVKFKAIEALVSAVPTVTTTIGAEGIGGDDLFWKVTDDPAEFASALSSALSSPEAAFRAAATAQQVRDRFSFERFYDRIDDLYRPYN